MKKRAVRPAAAGSRGRRKHGTSRLFVLGAAFTASAVAAAPTMAAPQAQAPTGTASAGSAAASAVVRFEIAAGPLAAAMTQFGAATGIKVTILTNGIGELQSAGVRGTMTARQALQQLLNGTGVSSAFTAANAVALDLRPLTETVSVTGDATKVTSPKFVESLRDTPVTVVVVPQQVFQEQNATSLREALRNTPGITMSIGEGGTSGSSSGDNVMIRGFSARNDIYIDGARDAGLVSRDMFNTEVVEIAKGPSSVTTGRGSTGGSINLITKTARLQDMASVRLTAGSASTKRGTFDVNRKLSGATAVRLNAMWEDSGYAGRDVAKNTGWGLAPSLAFGIDTPTQLTLNYTHVQADNIPDWGLPTLLPDTAIAQHVTVNDLDFSNFYGIASRDYEVTKSDIGTVTINHDFSRRLSLRNFTRYGRNYRDAVLTPPRPATATAGQGPDDPGYNPLLPQMRRTDAKYQHRDDRAATNQTDLTTEFVTGPLLHRSDIGLEVARDRQPTYAFTDLFSNGRPPVSDLFAPTPFISYTPAFARTGATSDATAISTALYVFDTIKLGNRWQADLGLRWDRVDVDYATVSATGVRAELGRVDRAISGRAGLVYKPVEQGSIYAAYSTSFTPSFDGTLGLTLAATGINSEALPPEDTRNIEVGTKWAPTVGLEVTAAAFRIEKTNAKTTALSGATVLEGDQRVQGVEFGVSGNITSRWGAFAGLALMDGTVKGSGIVTEIGQRLAYVPETSLNLWTTYRLPNGLTLGGGTNYNSGNYFNQTGGFLFVSNRADPRYVENAAAIQALTNYWVFNATAMYPLNAHILLQVNVNNLGNTRYADRAYDRHFLPGPARQVLFTPVITF